MGYSFNLFINKLLINGFIIVCCLTSNLIFRFLTSSNLISTNSILPLKQITNNCSLKPENFMFFKKSLILMFSLFVMGTTIFAQAPTLNTSSNSSSTSKKVTDQELKDFIAMRQEIGAMQKDFQKQIMDIVNNSGLDQQKFQTMAQAKMANKDVQGTPDEIKKFNDAFNKIESMQTEMQQKVQKVFAAHNLTQQRVQEIGMQIQKDKDLQNRANEMMQSQSNSSDGQ